MNVRVHQVLPRDCPFVLMPYFSSREDLLKDVPAPGCTPSCMCTSPHQQHVEHDRNMHLSGDKTAFGREILVVAWPCEPSTDSQSFLYNSQLRSVGDSERIVWGYCCVEAVEVVSPWRRNHNFMSGPCSFCQWLPCLMTSSRKGWLRHASRRSRPSLFPHDDKER